MSEFKTIPISLENFKSMTEGGAVGLAYSIWAIEELERLTTENTELKEHATEMLDDLNGYADIEEKLIAKIKKLEADNNEVNKLYQELIMAVGNKVPNEIRHETALRYILKTDSSLCSKSGG